MEKTEKTCKECKHFRRHYIRYERGKYSALAYGHCVFPRLKKRDTQTPACQHFVARKEGVVSE